MQSDLCGFLDTNIFIKMKYDFSHSSLFRLKKYVDLGIVRLFTNEIVIREVESNIKQDTAAESAHLKNAVKKHCFREVINYDGYELLNRDFRKEKWDEIIIEKFKKYINDTDCTILKNEDIKLKDIFELYFKCIPPFELKEEKKHEFPDAVMIQCLKNYLQQNNTPMVIVTTDKGWIKAFEQETNVEILDDLKKVLLKISSGYGKDIASNYIEFLAGESTKVLDYVNDWLYKLDWDECFEPDISFDVEGIDDLEVENIKLFFDGFEFIDEEEACAKFKAAVTLTIEYEYENYDLASYDKEDGVYYNVLHGTAKEKHVCPIEFSVSVIKDENSMDIEDFNFDEVELSRKTEVSSEFTEDYEEPDEEYFAQRNYTTCPDCGESICAENDGLNGFCENCGKNH